MKNLFITSIIIISSILSGCGKTGQLTASMTGYSKTCVDGVLYIQFTSGASVAYAADGKIQTCK